jgi:hypothetical protein
MDFKTFQSSCKYAHYGLKQGTIRDFELTCRKPECIPQGHSWGICDEIHCPHFGLKCGHGVMTDATTGKPLLTFNGGRIIFGN